MSFEFPQQKIMEWLIPHHDFAIGQISFYHQQNKRDYPSGSITN